MHRPDHILKPKPLLQPLHIRDIRRRRHENDRLKQTVGWESNRYPPQQVVADDQCWELATVGSALPAECLSGTALIFETSAYERTPWLAFAGSLLVAAALLWFALRRIAWRPTVQRRTAGDPVPRQLSAADAVNLMRNVSEEKDARGLADQQGRDVPRPALAGAFTGLLILTPLVFVFGYGTSLGWGIITSLLLFIATGTTEVVLLVPLPTRPSDPGSVIPRLLFIAGVAAALLVVSFVGVHFRTPMLELNGLAWPGS